MIPYSEKIWRVIKFGNFGQNAISFNLVSFKFGDLGPQPPNVTSLLQCKPSLVIDRVPVACNFKLTEGLCWAVSLAHLPILALSSTCASRWDWAHRAYCLWYAFQERTSLATRNSSPEREELPISRSLESIQLSWWTGTVRNRMYLSGRPAGLNRRGLIMAEFN